ncbi:GNAT family N-acetyltransferase [Caldalkalibacillus salinus]|uniref:GNAT family N-acetyltransferase n=1 Tax=Caldalkalibacillus salinus TaxID=2803787 RepID=UPI0019248A90|nr:GNAT family N-acetyltransferase [Caldalkalibacillus salinus]
MIYFESERLLFRDWEDKDIDMFINMNQDRDVMAYFAHMPTEPQIMTFLQAIKAEFEQYGYGLYAVETKSDEKCIGFIGFHWATFEAEFTPCIEIGWRLVKEAWGNGYATEGAKACLAYGFNELKFKDVYSFTTKLNTRSENVMRKIGMSKCLEFDHPRVDRNSKLLRHVLYHIGNETK